MRHRLVPGRSHSGSTGCDRPPGGQDVTGRIDVPIMAYPTSGASPLANVQRQPVEQVPTGATGLTRWIPSVNHNHTAAIPVNLVLQHRPELGPRRVRDGTRQVPMSHHVTNAEILDHNRLVLADEPSRQLMEKVPAPVDDPTVRTGQQGSGFRPVAGALLLPRQPTCGQRKTVAVPPLVAGIGDLFAAGQGNQRGQARIHTNLARAGSQVTGTGLHEDRHEPPSGRIPRHSHRRGLKSLGQRTRPHNCQWLRQLGKSELSVSSPERRAGVLRSGPRSLARLEARIPGPLLPKVRERLLQVPQALLQRYRRNLIQEPEFAGLLPLSQKRRGLSVTDPACVLIPSSRTGFQGAVVDQPHAAERAGQMHSLLVSGVEAVLVRPPYLRRRHAAQPIEAPSKNQTGVRSPAAAAADCCYGSAPPRSEGGIVRRLESR
jgi:hypothetical protein